MVIRFIFASLALALAALLPVQALAQPTNTCPSSIPPGVQATFPGCFPQIGVPVSPTDGIVLYQGSQTLINRLVGVNQLFTSPAITTPTIASPTITGTATFSGTAAFTSMTGNVSAGTSIATSSTTARSMAARAADVVNVRDFGATGNGVSDDTTAINAAIQAVRAAQAYGGGLTLLLPQGKYRTNGTVNLTGMAIRYFKVMGHGAVVLSHATGLPAVDATGSKFVTIDGLSIIGDTVDEPTYGLQIGRPDTSGAGNCANWLLTDLAIQGNFSKAGMWNVACETLEATRLNINNGDATGDGLRQDGINHFGLSSAFVTVTLPVDASESFNDDHFTAPIIQVLGGVPLWSARSYGHKYDNGYFSTTGPYSVKLYSMSASDDNRFLHMRTHMEALSLTDIFLMTGPNASPALDGFTYEDFFPEASNSIFKLDTGVTSAAIGGGELQIGTFGGGATKIWDAPNSWTMSGHVALGVGATQFNMNNSRFRGCLDTGATRGFCSVETTSGVSEIQLGGDTSSAGTLMLLNGAAGSTRIVRGASGQLSRWDFGVSNNTESGGDLGSNYLITRYHDNGTVIDSPLQINRASGEVAVSDGFGMTGHFRGAGTVPTVASGAGDCGTSPVIAGADSVGRVTVGSGANGGKCTVTFATTWAHAATCMVANETSGARLVFPVPTTTTLAITAASTLTAGDSLAFHCQGY